MPDLVPVDYDPFAPTATPPNRLPPRFGTGEASPAFQRATDAAIQGTVQRLTLPGRAAQGVQPETPGMWSEEDEFRRQQLEGEAANWAPQQALNMLGSGTPFAQAGAAGAAGGKLKSMTPVEGNPFEPIRAYHGSPYDFEKFDISKIGTGEGAQAYGHGLYFAENPAVAADYKKTLATKYTDINRQQLTKDASEALGSSSKYLPWAVLKELEAGTPIDNVWSKLSADPLTRGRTSQEINAAIDYVKTNYPNHAAVPGKTYEVAINADPEHFLDWDKPLSEQPQVVEKIKASPQYQQMAAANHFGYSPQEFAQLPLERQQKLIAETSPKTHEAILWEGRPGHGLLQSFESSFGGSDKATEALREAGIPGIKYLDQGSRAAGEGTKNYVIFNHDLIDIIKKYGLAGLIAGGAAHFSLPQQRQSQ